MFLDQYNKLMNDMLNERYVLAKLRAELEGREGRLCRCCRRFGHLAQKCRSKEEEKKRTVVENSFEVLKNRVIQCRVREVRKQKVVEQKVKCFWCGQEGHKKWECPKKKEKRKEEATSLQEVENKMLL